MILSRISPSSLEVATKRIGREIFQRAEAAAPSVFSKEFWQQLAMNWLTRDESLKLRLFRFIEVMPALQDPAAIARHLDEYLKPGKDGPSEKRFSAWPGFLQLALAYRRHDSAYASLVANAARFACTQGARQFIAGSTPEQALASVRSMRRRRMTFTLDVLGETIIADRIARRNQELYINLFKHLSREARGWSDVPILDRAPWGLLPKVNISLKLSAIVVKFDPIDPHGAAEAVLDRLRPILRVARDCGAFVNIDMEHYAVKNLTLDIYQRVLMEPEFKDWSDCGIVIQCYMPDGESDIATLMAWARKRGTPITVRLVKGAYWDSETADAVRNGWPIPLFTEKRQSDIAFESVARRMLENADIIRPAFASHNVRSIAYVIAMEDALGLPPRTLELQMLTGMGDQLKRAMVGMKQRIRVYAPFGDLVTGMAYLIRRLIENTSNESFLRQSFGEHLPVTRLLTNPEKLDREPPLGPTIPKPLIQDPDEYNEMQPFENEPDMDFSRPENRQAMHDALGEVRALCGRKYPAVINEVNHDTREWRDSRNPSNPREVVGKTAVCDHAIADRAVEAARTALEGWSRKSPAERADLLDKAADILRRRRFEITAWMIREVGKTWREAQGDFMETADYLRFYAHEMRRLTRRPRRRDYPGETNEYLYMPRGVVLVVAPFCFPTALLTGMTAAALVTGNTVIMKPASAAGVCAAKMHEILREAGLPKGVLNYVTGPGHDVGEYLVQHSGVDMIAFTGSREVGCRIIENARRLHPQRHSFKHVVAEMGGKNAIIIDDDADIDEAVQATIASAFGYSGQKCTACSRIIVLKSAYKAYLSKLVEAAEAIQPAAADLPGTTIGPLIDAEALERTRRYIEHGKEQARCILEGRLVRDENGAHFMAPSIFADVPPDARIAVEEIMAPVLAVMCAETFEHAVELANNTPYALTGGVYSRSPANIETAKRRLNAGMIYVNRKITLSRVDRQPFGGFNLSGLGTKTGGPDYLQQFTLPKTVSENTMRHGFSPANVSGEKPPKAATV
ncbi:MAG: proline dehydrogenase family protein [Phycisphaerales bacterium]|nr:proline dehydrogenase family protein [Phycisphaerales bacterium]